MFNCIKKKILIKMSKAVMGSQLFLRDNNIITLFMPKGINKEPHIQPDINESKSDISKRYKIPKGAPVEIGETFAINILTSLILTSLAFPEYSGDWLLANLALTTAFFFVQQKLDNKNISEIN